ncbi:hypothetical protein GGI25_000522 [Coemansia spiralis]|uniref:Spc7 kinetochore protein domain-containing protein n=2 Tax=Coemansia TaxID=4863 RepID=A0A9W8G773_9FUNG|nr:hypothetical protein EDC05_000350 [Coemansia umbellata]KAJ2625426.1 hypothetical protein GGI26_000566 [Coemansia sp. RSA 1358]KAJ2680549.1 hypothetical protein GGI25_000522 [Coemansia spiralis]
MDSLAGSRDSDSDGSPKRFKTNDQSALPVSILKDAPFADAETIEPEDRRKSRKSLGRRVSFAPTAHVRMFEIPEEKQAKSQGSNAYVMPDLSSQTGMIGFNLGTISTIDETSMTSNESFDVSVRHSELSDSVQSSEGSFATEMHYNAVDGNESNSVQSQIPCPANGLTDIQSQNCDNIIDDEDDDSLDENDGDDDAVTMELTGTVDMGVIRNSAVEDDPTDDSSDDEMAENTTHSKSSMHDPTNQSTSLANAVSGAAPLVSGADTNQILNALLQASNASQETSLLDNIISQFQSTQAPASLGDNVQSTVDLDFTRVDISTGNIGDDDRDTTIQPGASELSYSHNTSNGTFNVSNSLHESMDITEQFGGEMDDDSDSDDENNNEDAITMELTGIVSREQPYNRMATSMDGTSAERSNTSSSNINSSHTINHNTLLDLLQLPTTPIALQQPQQKSQQSTPKAISTPRTPKANIQGTSTRTPTAGASDSALASSLDLASIIFSAGTSEALSALFSQTTSGIPATNGLQINSLSPAAKAILQAISVPSTPHSKAPVSTTPDVPTPKLRMATPKIQSANSTTPGSRRSVITQTPAQQTPAVSLTPARTPIGSIAQSNPFYVGDNSPNGGDIASKNVEPTFVLDPLPPVPLLATQPLLNPTGSHGPSSLADQAKAGLVFDIYNAYCRQRLVPNITSESAQLSIVAAKFEPLFRKAKLTARLEYCSSLVSLFEADQDISHFASVANTDFKQNAAFFNENNDMLQQRKDELLLRISKIKQRLSEDAPGGDSGRTLGEIKQLKTKLAATKRERETTSARVEQISSEIQSLQATTTSFDRQVTEKKSAQKLLLAINGLQIADVSDDSCEFVYDRFAKLHLDTAAEFTSLHPDIDWNAVIRNTVDKNQMTIRQYSIAVMKLNAILKELLEDVKKVRRHTFVDIVYSDGIQVRMQLFSREMRRRFYLQVPIASLQNYRALHKETDFDWTTEILYGRVNESKLKTCLRACRVDSTLPLLSIYQHLESSMESY